MNSEADVSCSIQYVRAGMHHNWVTGLSSLTERCPFYNKSLTYYPHAPLSPILTLLSLLTYFSLTYSLETPFSLHFSRILHFNRYTFLPDTQTNRHLSPGVRKTSSPLHYHPKRLLGLISSEDTYPKPTVMNLNTALPLKLVSQCILW